MGSNDYNLLIRKEYFKRFIDLSRQTETYKNAFELLEDEMFSKYGINRYSSYESFRKNKSLYYKSIRENKPNTFFIKFQ